MKANRTLRGMASRLPLLAACPALALLASCVPSPAPTPTPAPAPTRAPQPAPPARPAPPPSADWRDAPATPGDWVWSAGPGATSASFAGGQLVLRCDAATRAITLIRATAQPAAAPAALSVTTSQGTRSLTGTPVGAGLAASVPARDPLLDEMAFSRGRFMVGAAGLPPLYVPSWPEVSRVIEDCR